MKKPRATPWVIEIVPPRSPKGALSASRLSGRPFGARLADGISPRALPWAFALPHLRCSRQRVNSKATRRTSINMALTQIRGLPLIDDGPIIPGIGEITYERIPLPGALRRFARVRFHLRTRRTQ